MLNRPDSHRARGRTVVATLAATAAVALAVVAGVAVARSFTLTVAAHAKVTNASGSTRTEAIAVNARQHAVYYLTGDSRRHPECTAGNGCYASWPPVTVAAGARASKEARIKGKLGVWRHGGISQVTLNGHPLYTFVDDVQRRRATGEGLTSFGGTWYVIQATAH